MRYKKIKIGDVIYEADIDFRTMLKCVEITMDKTIGQFEQLLGVICTVFGDKGVDHHEHYEKLYKWIENYLLLGTKSDEKSVGKPDIDFIKDKKYIESSFKFDYNYDPYKMEFLSWEEFINDLKNLSNNEFGTCCILNRVRNLRNMDVNKIKDPKQREELRQAQKMVALDFDDYKKPKKFSNDELENMNKFYEQTGL